MDLINKNILIIGYRRKSKTTAGNEKGTKCLHSMVLGLKERSLVQHVYVTVSCESSTPFRKREKKNAVINHVSGISGKTQGI